MIYSAKITLSDGSSVESSFAMQATERRDVGGYSVVPVVTMLATGENVIDLVDYANGNRIYYGRGIQPSDRTLFDTLVVVPEKPVSWPLDMPIGQKLQQQWREYSEAHKNNRLVASQWLTATEEIIYYGRERVKTQFGDIDACKINNRAIKIAESNRTFTDITMWIAAEGVYRGHQLKAESRNESGVVESTVVVTKVTTFD